jgi:DNA-binding transcriptional ArsR family regulator
MVVGSRSASESRNTDRLFHALADPTRRDILLETLVRERSVSDLACLYPMSFAAVQKHVAVLADAGLVSKHRSGREQLVRGEIDRVRDAHRLLDELELIWRDRLDRFGEVLADSTSAPTPSTERKEPS